MPENSLKGISYSSQYVVSSKSQDFDNNKDDKLLNSIDSSRRILTAVDGFKVGETKMRPQILNFRLQKTKVIGKEPTDKEKGKSIEMTNPSSYVLWEYVNSASGASGSFVEMPIAVDY